MANYFIDNNGNWSNKNKKQSGNNYTINSSGQWVNNTVKKTEKNSNANPFVVAGKTVGNALTNLGTGAIKAVEGTADFISDVIANPIERGLNYVYDYASKGKKVADENYKDLKEMQKRDIKRDLTKEFQDYTGFSDIKEDWEKDSLIKSDNFGGQVAQGIGGMVPSLVVGGAYGGTPTLESTKGLSGLNKAKTIASNVGKTYMAQAPANLVLGASSYGSGVEEALNKGATLEQARRYGIDNALIEQGTEMLTGGIPGLQGKGGIDQFIDPLIDKTGGYLKPLLKTGYSALGEGIEESAGTYLDALAKRNILNEDIDWNKVNKEALQSGLVGATTGAILNTPSNIQNFQNAKVENQLNNEQNLKENNNKEENNVENVQKSVVSGENTSVEEKKSPKTNKNAQKIEKTVQNNQEIVETKPKNKQESLVKSKKYQEAKQKVADGTATEKERSYIKTATEAQNTEEMTKLMDDTVRNYEVLANEKTLKSAESVHNTFKSIDDGAKYVSDILKSDKRLNATDMAVAELVLKDAAASKNTKIYNEVLGDLAIYATEQGQSIQALSMIKKLSPTSQLDVLEKIINREKAKGNKAYQNVEVTEEMRNKIFDCYDENGKIDQEKFDATMEEIKNELGKNIKSDLGDKIRSWRYLSMLGNPKTHIRNVVANAAMTTVKAGKDLVNAAGQDIFIRDKRNKTATLKFASKDVKQLANETSKTIFSNDNTSKYSEKSDLESRKQVFGFKPIEKYRIANETLLSKEDTKSKKTNFKKSFANYLTAQGISTQADIEANPKIIQEATNFAIQEANIATFNERNKLSEYINKLDNLGVAGKAVRGAIIPFSRTPLNIAKRGLEYTPGTGMITTISDFKKAPKNMKGAVLIDGLSKQMTGASLAVLGYALAKSGMVTAKTDDDKDDKFKKDQGSISDYSIKLGDTSYDLSWLSPSSMPFFVGARMFEVLDKQEGINPNVIMEGLASTLDPLTEMSVIQSFTDVLSSYKNDPNQMLKEMGETAAQNYLSQFIPTISGQFAKWFDDTKRTTYADANSNFSFGQETARKLAYKIPGLRNTLPASTDYLGNNKKEEENFVLRGFDSFINPANKKKDTMTKEGKELVRLYEKTGNDSIIPYASRQNVKFNDNNYQMSRKEYNEYKKDFGDSLNDNLKDLMKTNDYKKATDDEKATMVEGIMNYSKDKAKDDFLTNKGEEYSKTRDKVDSLTNNNFSVADYYIYKTYAPNIMNGKEQDVRNRLNLINAFGIDYQIYSKYMSDVGDIKADKYSNGKTISNSRKKKVFEYINGLNISKEQKEMLMKKEYSTNSSNDITLFNTINNSNLTLQEKESLKNFLKIGK